MLNLQQQKVKNIQQHFAHAMVLKNVKEKKYILALLVRKLI